MAGADEKLSDQSTTTTTASGFLHIVKSLTSYKIAILNLFAGTVAPVAFGGQAHGGNYTKSFSASATFNADDGNNQYMAVSASTTIDISNLDEGIMIIKLKVIVGTSPTITIGASLGDVMDGASTILNANGDVNTLTIVKGADGLIEYTVSTVTA